MLTINEGQLTSLSQQQSHSFIEELNVFLREKDPFHAAAIGDEGLRAFSQLVIERARFHQFTQKSTVKLFGQMMMYLGTYFDTDPALPWAALTLQQPQDSVTTQTNRANLLREELCGIWKRLVGVRADIFSCFFLNAG